MFLKKTNTHMLLASDNFYCLLFYVWVNVSLKHLKIELAK